MTAPAPQSITPPEPLRGNTICQKCATRHPSYLPCITPPEVGGELVERLGKALREALGPTWTHFLDANPDDLTSPEDLPDHALMTGEQFESWAMDAFLDAIATLSTPEVVDRTAGLVEAAFRAGAEAFGAKSHWASINDLWQQYKESL